MISHAQVDTSLSTLSSPVSCLLSPLSSNVSLNFPLSAHFFPPCYVSALHECKPAYSTIRLLFRFAYICTNRTDCTYIYIHKYTVHIDHPSRFFFFLLSVLRRATHFTVTLRCSTAVIDTRSTCFSFLVSEFVIKQVSFCSKRN